MPNFIDFCATIRPGNQSVEDTVDELEEFIEKDIADLPDPPEPLRSEIPAGGFESLDGGLKRHLLEIDSDDGQAYIGGRTYDGWVRRGWRRLLVEEGVGQGVLAEISCYEAELSGWGWLFDWEADGYEPVLDEDNEFHYSGTDGYQGEHGLFGMDVAESFAERRDIRPARFAPNTEGGVRKPVTNGIFQIRFVTTVISIFDCK